MSLLSAFCRRGAVSSWRFRGSALDIVPRFALRRLESTASNFTQSGTSLRFPELLNVYRAGSAPTLSIGLCRMAAVGFIGCGCFLVAPAFFFSSDHSSLWIPLIVIGSAIPLVVLTLATGPVVHAIRVRLPLYARRSRDDLKNFITNAPPDTILSIECIRFLPWPTKIHVKLGDLRRINPSFRKGLVNLEHIPKTVQQYKDSVWFGLVRRWLGRYWVSRDQKRDRSASPGLWNELWERIPAAGSAWDPLNRDHGKERKPVEMAGRTLSPRTRKRKPTITAVPPPRRPR